MTDSNNPSHEQITRRAYEIFIERGSPEGRDLEHWLEAEKQLRSAGQAKSSAAVKSSAPITASQTTMNAPIRGTQPAPSNGRPGNGRPASRAASKK